MKQLLYHDNAHLHLLEMPQIGYNTIYYRGGREAKPLKTVSRVKALDACMYRGSYVTSPGGLSIQT